MWSTQALYTICCSDFSKKLVNQQGHIYFGSEKMRGGKRIGAGRKKKPNHLRRELVTIRLPQWIISQIKSKGIK